MNRIPVPLQRNGYSVFIGTNIQWQETDDNIRVYVPLDINRQAILRRLDYIIAQYGEANERNELDFSFDVSMLISQIEIYDQIWSVRHMPEKGNHSMEAVELIRELEEEFLDGNS